ncbi:hypothetical protein QQ008_18745 [Fulvivirgaceae bacterium BMA10]|uniref:Transporter n=1 Tax=Splendidivirga corallicola TaxID=3051826 RepID=A0ABT8KTX2_9BACT|nr:hypothetical protein [Fulvivirgaceae bacterium BMA10]
MKTKFAFIIFFLFGIHHNTLAQTCCSGGVPISSNVGLPAGAAKSLQVTLNYDLNVLKTLKEGTRELADGSRERTTQSFLLGLSYTISDRFAVDGLFSYIRQERFIVRSNDRVVTNGFGDAVFLLKYRVTAPVNTKHQFFIGGGIKLPTGASDLKNNQGLTLILDLQPGSGALDQIAWANYIGQLKFRPSMNFISTFTYRFTGKNNEYLGTQVYELGEELQFVVGLSDRLFIKNVILDPSISLRYRFAGHDQNDGLDQPSTGGDWLFLEPSISYAINPNFSVNAMVNVPIYSRVDGTQLSPTMRFNAGIHYNINLKKKDDLLQDFGQ